MELRGKAKARVLRRFGLGLIYGTFLLCVLHSSTRVLAGACVFEETIYFPTPSASWNPTPGATLDGNISGYVVFYREPGGTWQRGPDVPCQRHKRVLSDPNDEDFFFCHGHRVGSVLAPGEISWPLQRGLNLTANRTFEFCVRAKNLANQESELCSNVVSICWAPYRVF